MQSKNTSQKVYQRYVGGLYQIMTARFLEEQPPVKIVKIEGKAYIYICLNGVQKNEMYDQDGERQLTEYYEYDYNEFTLPVTADLENVRENPEKYLNYSEEEEETDAQKIERQSRRIDELTECLLEMSEVVYK